MSTVAADSLLDAYRAAAGRHDEMVAADGSIRPAWQPMGALLDRIDLRELRRRQAEVVRLLEDDGVTYHVPGTGERVRWQLDPLPLVVSAEDWAAIESGIVQRAELLNLVLGDLYGPRRLLRDGLIPPQVVLANPGFLRPLHGQRLPIRQQLFTYATDLVRDGAGTIQVLTDRTQAPSGAAYALQNRVVTSRVLSQLHRASHVQRLAPYFRSLRQGLQEVAPRGVTLPRTVLLTPGSRNETAFEHAFLAARLGVALVEGSDLTVQGGRVWLRSLGHLEPVDVILRRQDQEWCDPLELRRDSLIGVPGLVEAVRSGAVSVVNSLGSGAIENPALQAFLPAIAQALLGQPLRLAGVRTLWLGDPQARREVLADLGGWVLKPTYRSSAAERAAFTATLTGSQLAELRARIAADPDRWVAQESLTASTAPTLTATGLVPRGTMLRTFAVASGDSYTVMPGGLTRVAPEDGVVGARPGSVSKDTWVLAGRPEPMTGFWMEGLAGDAVTPESTIPSRAAENLYWLGRYAERAEGAARLLREVDDRRTEFTGGTRPRTPMTASSELVGSADAVVTDTPVAAGTACVTALLQALTHVTTTYPGFVGTGAPARLADPDAELDALAGDGRRPGTLAHAVRSLLDAVDAVRDLLSADTWLVVVDLQRLVTLAEQSRSAVTDTAKILHGLLAIQGLAAENMVRDAGWRFMDAGRRLERSLQVLALLRATTTAVRDTAADSLVLESVLRVAESIITYRRRYRSRAQIGTLLDLLLLDPDNPRSLTYQLDLLTEDLRLLPDHPGPGRVSASERAVLEASTALRVADTTALSTRVDGGRRRELDEFLEHLQGLLLRAGQDIAAAHFTHLKRQREMGGGTELMRYRVVHATTYTYASEVSASYGEAHLLPRDLPGQTVLSADLAIAPPAEDQHERLDWFGNRTTHFAIGAGHTTLSVTATSEVEVAGRGLVGRLLADQPWESVRDVLRGGWEEEDVFEAGEFTLPSPQVPTSPAAAAYAVPSFRPGRPVLEAVEDLSRRIHTDFAFTPGVTTVGTPLNRVLAARAGVCQDFAHLMIAALRSMGLAARYVSGYLETDPPPGRPKLQGADVSHAWVSVFVPQTGWVDVDPTNDQLIGDRHITTAWGRDYGDVSPLRGVIFTDGETESLRVSVDVRRVDPVPRPPVQQVPPAMGQRQMQGQQQQGPSTSTMDL